MPTVEIHLDGRWRPEPHPFRDGEWLAVRYVSDLGKPRREVWTSATDATRPLCYPTEDACQVACDVLNPAPGAAEEVALGDAQRQWLERLAEEPEGVMERGLHRVLLSLEHLGLVESKAEPGRRGMDRWAITEKGRAELARRD